MSEVTTTEVSNTVVQTTTATGSTGENEEIIRLNVGGVIFETYRSTLTEYSDTLLGKMFSPQNQTLAAHRRKVINGKAEYFFDRNPRAFAIILDFYRTGKLDLQRPIDWPIAKSATIMATTSSKVNEEDEKTTSLFTVECPQGRKTSLQEYVARVGLAELREELDYFQIPELTWSDAVLSSLHVSAAARISKFVDTLFDLAAAHLDHFIEIVVIHFARGEDQDSASLRNVNRSVETACEHLLERCSIGFRLLSDEKLVQVVRECALQRFPNVRFTVQMVRHELLVLCLSGYLDVDRLRMELKLTQPRISRPS